LVETSAPQPPGIPSYDAEAGDPRFGRPPGLLEIASDPPGARVSINGLSRGVTPLVLDELPSGSHTVSISLHGAAVQRAVNLAPGRTATIIAAFAPNGPVEGWLSVEAPFDMQVREYGALVGTTSAGRLAMPEGRHELDLVSEAYGFRTRAEVQISSGKVATVTVKVPSGLLSVTALPWAEVWIDGKPAGATPLTDVPVPIGPHEVLFWHPEFGERRLSVAVTAATPAQVGVDFTR
jgi:hypothetical protein